MKKRKWGLFVASGLVLLALSACGHSNLETPKTSVSSHSLQGKSKPSASLSQPRSPVAHFNMSQESDFVKKFLTAYTTYPSLNAQKSALKPFLTRSMQKQLAVEAPMSQEVNQMTSVGQNLSIWQNDKGQWLGLVTVKINDQTTSVQVFLVGLQVSGQQLLVNQLSSPTQE